MEIDHVMFVVVGVVLTYTLALGACTGYAERECLQRGWRDAKVTFALQPYCVTRNDQTDIVKPLSQAEQR